MKPNSSSSIGSWIRRSALRDAIEQCPEQFRPRFELGSLLLDRIGDPDGAQQAFESAAAVAANPADQAMAHALLAHLLALHRSHCDAARAQADIALEVQYAMSPAGRQLLCAPTVPVQGAGPDWPTVFDAIGKAMTVGDPTLWTRHIEELLGLLRFIIVQGQGQTFRQWMDKTAIRDRYAPLYHAFVAALDGEDHLLLINPEVRQPAARIHAGLARRLRLYGGDKSSRKPADGRRSA
jgi:hypothetical protein